MSKPRDQFVIPVRDLEDGPRDVSWALPVDWLARALADTEAEPLEAGLVELTLSLNGREVVVRGRLEAQVTMPCVVTLDPVEVTVQTDVFLLLSPSPAPAGPKARSERARRRSNSDAISGWADDPLLNVEDAARDTYNGEEVALDRFLREFIILELPMSPRRSSLPTGPDEAIPHRSAESGVNGEPQIDPRLAPLAVIASRMRNEKE